MHPYATDSTERTSIPFYLAAAAIAAAWGLGFLLHSARIAPPWWLGAPSALGFYGILYKLFEAGLWRLSVIRRAHLVKVPMLDGHWQGRLTTSFDEHGSEHAVEVHIRQTWSRLSVELRGEESLSHSIAASLIVEEHQVPILSYQYLNEPLPQAKQSMAIHFGTTVLRLVSPGRLNGEYYSGRGRQNVGALVVVRVDTDPASPVPGG